MNGLMNVLPAAERDKAARFDGWTGERQAVFLRALADCGVVETAAAEAGVSVAAAYAFRRRADGAIFHLGWQGALLLARRRLFDTLLARAIEGQVDTLTREDNVAKRHRHDNRLGCTLLGRLDRFADESETLGEEAVSMRLVAQDFDRFVDMIEQGAGGAEAALMIEATRARQTLQIAAVSGAHGHPQLQDDEEGEKEDEEAGRKWPPDPEWSNHQLDLPMLHTLDVWENDADEWVTNFPPPPDFEGYEDCSFGDEDYQRSLTPEELYLVERRQQLELAAFRAAAEEERQKWLAHARNGAAEVSGEARDAATL